MNDIPIAALRTFRVLARCGSFTAAARDLGCAQSVVSRHVAALEAHLQQTLVLRGHRRLQLTPAGEMYLETVQKVLETLDQGASRLGPSSERPTVKILSMPSFAARWLVPRLARLPEAHIDADIELTTSIWDVDFHKERYDIAIHYGDGAWPGARLLMRDGLVPVAAPQLLSGAALARKQDLSQFCWLHDSLRSSKWSQWLSACAAEGLDGRRHMTLQDTEATLTAAVEGLGIAMGHSVLVENDIRKGRLIEACAERMPLGAGYHLLQSKKAARNRAAQSLAAWLLAQAQPPSPGR